MSSKKKSKEVEQMTLIELSEAYSASDSHTYGLPTDPGAFDDNPLMEPTPGYPALCPQCLGHGGWILRRDGYGPGQHFKASCAQCSGWGYVKLGDDQHVHVWEHERKTGNCLNVYRCTVPGCTKRREVDSSD
jgi:hypothetical protein